MKLDDYPGKLQSGKDGIPLGFDDVNNPKRMRQEKIFASRGSLARDEESRMAQQLGALVLTASNMRVDPHGSSISDQEQRFLETDPLQSSPVHWVRAVFYPDENAVTLQLKTDGLPPDWEVFYYQVTVSRQAVAGVIGHMFPEAT
jgi:hypothetical protein